MVDDRTHDACDGPDGSASNGLLASTSGLVEAIPELVRLAEADPDALTVGERAEAVRALTSIHDQVAAALTHHVEAFDRHRDHEHDAARSVSAWIASRTELNQRTASILVERARSLRACPIVSEAHRAGVLGTAKADLLLGAREHVEARFADDEAMLTETIRPLTVRQARVVIAHWRRLALSELDHSPDDRDPHDPADNSTTIATGFEGRRILTATFDPVSGAEIEGFLAAEVDRRFASGEFRADDGLTLSRRTAIALHALLRRGSTTSTERGDLRPSVTVFVDLPRLLGFDATTTDELLAHRCQLADGTVLPLERVLELMQDATLTTVLGHFGLTGRFQPVGTITTARHANPAQRRALTARDQGCVFPGCDRPARWTDAHHVDGWKATHQTSVPRLVLLCSHHHHAVHERGFTLRSDRDGKVTVHRPDGSRLPTPAGPGYVVPTDPDPPTRPWKQLAGRRRNRVEREALATFDHLWDELTRPLVAELARLTATLTEISRT